MSKITPANVDQFVATYKNSVGKSKNPKELAEQLSKHMVQGTKPQLKSSRTSIVKSFQLNVSEPIIKEVKPEQPKIQQIIHEEIVEKKEEEEIPQSLPKLSTLWKQSQIVDISLSQKPDVIQPKQLQEVPVSQNQSINLEQNEIQLHEENNQVLSISQYQSPQQSERQFKINESDSLGSNVQISNQQELTRCQEQSIPIQPIKQPYHLIQDPNVQLFNQDNSRTIIELIDSLPQQQSDSSKSNDYLVNNSYSDQFREYQYMYYLEDGNNSNLIKELIEKRQVWSQTKDVYHKHINFKWGSTKKAVLFNKNNNFQGSYFLVNHLSNSKYLVDRQLLYESIQIYCKRENINIESIMPKQYYIKLNQEDYKSYIAKLYEQIAAENPTWDYNTKHLETLFQVKIAAKRQKQANYEQFYILKPTNLCDSLGVHIIDSFEQLFKYLHNYQNGYMQTHTQCNVDENGLVSFKHQSSLIYIQEFIVQHYIKTPKLINKKKFTVNFYVLVNQFEQIFHSKECLIYSSLNNYDESNIREKESGCLKDLDNIQEQAILKSIMTDQEIELVLNQIKMNIKIIMISIKNQLFKDHNPNQIGLFRFEFLISQDLKVQLVDINEKIQWESPNYKIQQFLYNLLDSAFQLTIDQIFKPKEEQQEISQWIKLN